MNNINQKINYVLLISKSIRQEPWNYSCSECDSCESKYACPAYNCSKHGNQQIKWTHGSCGGGLRLYENGKEKCEDCKVEALFCFWNCSCYDESKNEKQYSYKKIKNILAKLAGMDTRHCSTYFLIHVTLCIDKQWRDHPEKLMNNYCYFLIFFILLPYLKNNIY